MMTVSPRTRSNWSKAQDVSRIYDIDRLCKLIGVETLTDYDDKRLEFGDTYSNAYAAAIQEGATEAEAEEKALKAEGDERDEYTGKYRNAVVDAAEWLLGEHGLILIPLKDGWHWRLAPKESWLDAASKLVQTINGYGMFEFRDARELCSSGPYTPCQAVMNHLGWMKRYAEVYGDRSAADRVERAMRY